MSTLNPLNLVPEALQSKYLPDMTAAFSAARAKNSVPDLGVLETQFHTDGGTVRQWDVLKHCASVPAHSF